MKQTEFSSIVYELYMNTIVLMLLMEQFEGKQKPGSERVRNQLAATKKKTGKKTVRPGMTPSSPPHLPFPHIPPSPIFRCAPK